MTLSLLRQWHWWRFFILVMVKRKRRGDLNHERQFVTLKFMLSVITVPYSGTYDLANMTNVIVFVRTSL